MRYWSRPAGYNHHEADEEYSHHHRGLRTQPQSLIPVIEPRYKNECLFDSTFSELPYAAALVFPFPQDKFSANNSVMKSSCNVVGVRHELVNSRVRRIIEQCQYLASKQGMSTQELKQHLKLEEKKFLYNLKRNNGSLVDCAFFLDKPTDEIPLKLQQHINNPGSSDSQTTMNSHGIFHENRNHSDSIQNTENQQYIIADSDAIIEDAGILNDYDCDSESESETENFRLAMKLGVLSQPSSDRPSGNRTCINSTGSSNSKRSLQFNSFTTRSRCVSPSDDDIQEMDAFYNRHTKLNQKYKKKSQETCEYPGTSNGHGERPTSRNYHSSDSDSDSVFNIL